MSVTILEALQNANYNLDNLEKGLAYWIYYEDGHTFYCENCIDKRVNDINENKEFSEDIDYEGGDECGFMSDWADQDYEVECCKCSAPLLSNFDDVSSQIT